jgi:hypothetical protein
LDLQPQGRHLLPFGHLCEEVLGSPRSGEERKEENEEDIRHRNWQGSLFWVTEFFVGQERSKKFSPVRGKQQTTMSLARLPLFKVIRPHNTITKSRISTISKDCFYSNIKKTTVVPKAQKSAFCVLRNFAEEKSNNNEKIETDPSRKSSG